MTEKKLLFLPAHEACATQPTLAATHRGTHHQGLPAIGRGRGRQSKRNRLLPCRVRETRASCHLFEVLTPTASFVYSPRWCLRHRQHGHNQVVDIALHVRWRLTPSSPLVVSSLQTPYPRRTHVRDARSECPRRTLRPRGNSNEFSHGALACPFR